MFFKYLEWIVATQKIENFDLSYVHTNNEDMIKSMPVKKGTYDDVIHNSDIVFSLGYWKKIPKNDIENVPMGIVNFHHSYQLKFQGRHCSTWVLMHNEKIHGSTMHFIDEKIDEGKIIDSDFFTIEDNDVAEDIFFKSNNTGLDLLKKNFMKIINKNDIDYQFQQREQFCYRAKDLNHEVALNVVDNDLLRKIRALTFDKMPSPYLLLEGKKVFLKLEGYDDGILKKQ